MIKSIIGNAEIINFNKLALFCSIKCPGEIILKLHEFVQKLSSSDITVISGFHSPVEKGVFDMLLRRKQTLIICPARSIKNIRIPKEWKRGIEEGWILVVSQFEERHRRITAELSEKRNRFIAEMADKILIAYANKGGKLERFASELLEKGKKVWTFESDYNKGMIESGANVLRNIEDIVN